MEKIDAFHRPLVQNLRDPLVKNFSLHMHMIRSLREIESLDPAQILSICLIVTKLFLFLM